MFFFICYVGVFHREYFFLMIHFPYYSIDFPYSFSFLFRYYSGFIFILMYSLLLLQVDCFYSSSWVDWAFMLYECSISQVLIIWQISLGHSSKTCTLEACTVLSLDCTYLYIHFSVPFSSVQSLATWFIVKIKNSYPYAKCIHCC